jgi:hypothetical protein
LGGWISQCTGHWSIHRGPDTAGQRKVKSPLLKRGQCHHRQPSRLQLLALPGPHGPGPNSHEELRHVSAARFWREPPAAGHAQPFRQLLSPGSQSGDPQPIPTPGPWRLPFFLSSPPVLATTWCHFPEVVLCPRPPTSFLAFVTPQRVFVPLIVHCFDVTLFS